MSDSLFTSDVWSRRRGFREVDVLDHRLFMFLVSFWTMAGVFFSLGFSMISYNWDISGWDVLFLLVPVLVVAFYGCSVSARSTSVPESLFGFALIAGALGLLLGPSLSEYQAAAILKAFILTTGMVLILGTIGALIPEDLSSWGRPLMGALLLLIGALLLSPLLTAFGIPIETSMSVLDWAGIIIFGAFVLYDLNRAARLPRTAKNAIDAAIGIYLDWFNIFVRVLGLGGRD